MAQRIQHPIVHQEGFAIKAQRSAPRFVKSNHATLDGFGSGSLTITGPATLFDVTPEAPGTTPPAPFLSDPTGDPTVNRFKCYKAKLAQGSGRFIPPASPTIVDEFFPGGQTFAVTKVTKLCTPVDKNGETPGAETRTGSLLCYAVALPKSAPKFSGTTVATNDTNVAAHALVARKPAELCVPVSGVPMPTPSPTPTATPGPTPTGFKRVFATSTTHNGGFGGISGADTLCAMRASAAGLSGSFKAWLSASGGSPSSTFAQSALSYGLVDGTVVALDWSDLVDGTLAHRIDQDENGSTAGGDVWTGTDTAGNAVLATCNNWSSSSSSASGQCGSTAQVGSAWTASSTPTCNIQLRLYCFEQ